MKTDYQQSCAVPYRIVDNEVEFCLITSRKRGDWIFPKGNIDGDETPQETALKEANEEAGLEGQIVTSLQAFTYEKMGFLLDTAVQLMLVTKCQETWLEQKCRKRMWSREAQAHEIIERREMKTALSEAIKWLNDNK